MPPPQNKLKTNVANNPINNGKIMINGRRKITCRVRDITIPSFAIPIEVKKPEDTGWIPFAKVININIFR